MKKPLLTYLLLFFMYSVVAQTTFQQTNSFPNLIVASSDVGDYDNDGDLDIVIMGSEPGSGHFTRIYNNDGVGNFSLSSFVFNEPYRNGQIEFVDYDNDNDLDIFVSGLVPSAIYYKSALYQNNAGTFTEVSSNLGGNIINNQFSWADLDNDGDLDVVLMGDQDTFFSPSFVYRNDGNNTFTELTHNIEGFSQGKVLMADLDKDGDIDVVCGGLKNDMNNPSDPFDTRTEVYRNDGNFSFVKVATLNGIMNGDAELRDYNKDGWLDIILTGSITITGNSATKIFYNNTNFAFSDAGITLASSSNDSNITTGDYTGNGELDILMMLSNVRLYGNDGNMLTLYSNIGITGAYGTDIEIGDFNNDHDLDVLIIDNPTSGAFENQTTVANTLPQAPTTMNQTVTGSDVTLSWDKGQDTTTPIAQLTYNIYVGTTSGATDIVTPMSDLSNGYRKIVALGNTSNTQELKLENLPDGTYYWSVQSIDNQYEGSPFAAEQTFTIGDLSVSDVNQQRNFTYYPNAVINDLKISSAKTIEEVTIYATVGKEISTISLNRKDVSLDFSKLATGMYFVSVRIEGITQTVRIIKK